jgi:hypothetical protein
MILRRRSAAVLLLGTLALTACKATGPAATDALPSGASPTIASPTDDASPSPSGAASTGGAATPASSKHPSSKPARSTSPSPRTSTAAGPRIVSFKVVQKPKCAEGTAVFRADPVDLIIKWKITGADSAALSVDDPTHTPGTYGAEGLEGTESFGFSCAGPTGTIETHTYAIYTVGGGTQKSKTLKVSAKVLDKGIGNG